MAQLMFLFFSKIRFCIFPDSRSFTLCNQKNKDFFTRSTVRKEKCKRTVLGVWVCAHVDPCMGAAASLWVEVINESLGRRLRGVR